LENVNIADFKFPAAFGSDFFLADSASGKFDGKINYCADGNCATTVNAHNYQYIRTSDIKMKKEGRKGKAKRAISGDREGYKSRHFEMSKINDANPVRAAYYEKLDDLYIICADIAAANEKSKQVTTNIKSESAELKSLAKELKQNPKAKGDF
jgi:hypothetical protein